MGSDNFAHHCEAAWRRQGKKQAAPSRFDRKAPK
jgi:hypothetical protein